MVRTCQTNYLLVIVRHIMVDIDKTKTPTLNDKKQIKTRESKNKKTKYWLFKPLFRNFH